MTQTGEANLNWTSFKEKHLFSINVAIIAGLILYKVRGDFTYHWALILWPVLTALIPKLRQGQTSFFQMIGHFNSTIILGGLYFLILTPYSILYRSFFKNPAFKKVESRFSKKTEISSFDRPF